MKFIKKYYINILSFVIPIGIFLIVCALNDLFPLGKHYLNIYDGNLQHTGFLEYFKNVLLGNESLFYSFKGALGYNFYAILIYYLSSPLNLLSVFFTNESIYIFYTIIILLKIGLCGLTCSILLKYFRINKYIILFASTYALMSYNILYYLNIMWLDSVILLPLVVLGIEKLIKENKKTLYFITLSLSILFNFYIGFMICIFSVIYFIYKYFLIQQKKRRQEILKKFLIISFLAGVVCSIILIPVFFELINGKISGFSQANQTDYFTFSLDFFNAFYKITPASFTATDISYGSPNVYISLFIISLVLLYFFNKKVSIKEKIIIAIVLAFYLLCFSFNLFDYSWHMLQRPIWYPNRYSFTLSLFLIIIAYKSFINLDAFKINKFVVITFLVVCCIIFSSAIYNNVLNDKQRVVFLILSILLLIDYLFIFSYKKNLKLLLILFLGLELFINSYCIVKKTPHENRVKYYSKSFSSLSKDLKIIQDRETSDFYRIEFNSTPNYNNGSLFSYNGINFFSSIRDSKTMNYLENTLGVKVSDGCSVTYNSNNPIINTYLGVKYFDGEEHEDYYERISKKNRYIYYNDLTTPLFYLVDDSVYNTKFTKDRVYNYASIYKNVVKDNSKLIDENFEIKTNNLIVKDKYIYRKKTFGEFKYYKTIKEDAWLSFYDMDQFSFYSPHIYINGKEINDLFNKRTTLFLRKGDKLLIDYTITSEKVDRNNIRVYLINHSSLKKYSDKINKNKVNIIKHDKDSYLKAKINVKDDKVLATTIPYSKGWNVYVDGKKVKKELIYDTFISINLTKGTHIIEFKFIPRGFIIGLIISIVSLIISIIYIRKKE